MSQIESTRWEELAGALFDELVVPLAVARRISDADDYFPRRGEEGSTTYFVQPRLPTMGAADFEPHIGHADGLLDALAALWAAEGATELQSLLPHLPEIADALAHDDAQSDGTVDVLCYTLFRTDLLNRPAEPTS